MIHFRAQGKIYGCDRSHADKVPQTLVDTT